VGQAAGITGPGVYGHFANKNDLFLAVIERVETRRIAHVAAIVEEAESPREALELLVDDLVSTVLDDRGVSAVLWRQLRHLDATGTGLYDRLHGLHVAEFVHALSAIRPGLSDSEYRALVDGLYGLVLAAADHDSELDREAVRRTVVGLGLSVLLG
jgi:AcrR family transcriptional regulator